MCTLVSKILNLKQDVLFIFDYINFKKKAVEKEGCFKFGERISDMKLKEKEKNS